MERNSKIKILASDTLSDVLDIQQELFLKKLKKEIDAKAIKIYSIVKIDIIKFRLYTDSKYKLRKNTTPVGFFLDAMIDIVSDLATDKTVQKIIGIK